MKRVVITGLGVVSCLGNNQEEVFNSLISTNDVINTNYCKISVCKDRKSNKVIIISALDNLIKGASGQAVQNMNVAFKLKETMGLI